MQPLKRIVRQLEFELVQYIAVGNETIDRMTNTAFVLVADWFPGGEMAVEQ